MPDTSSKIESLALMEVSGCILAPGREGKMEILVRVLKAYHEKMKSRRGGKAIVFLARKFRGVIDRTLKNKWVFEDFPNVVLAEGQTE